MSFGFVLHLIELAQAAHVVYKALTFKPDVNVPAKTKFSPRKELEKYFGAISNAIYLRLVEQVDKLSTWKEAVIPVDGPSATVLKQATAKLPMGSVVYGASINVVIPPASAGLNTAAAEQKSLLDITDTSYESDEDTAPTAAGSKSAGSSSASVSKKTATAVSSNTSKAAAPSSSTSFEATSYNMDWLVRQCEKFATFAPR